METKRLTDAANRNDRSYTALLTMLQSISALVAKTKGELDISDPWYPPKEAKQVVTSHAEAWNKAKEEVLAAGGRREGKTLKMAAGYGGTLPVLNVPDTNRYIYQCFADLEPHVIRWDGKSTASTYMEGKFSEPFYFTQGTWDDVMKRSYAEEITREEFDRFLAYRRTGKKYLPPSKRRDTVAAKPPSFMPEIPHKPLGPDMPMVGQKWVTKNGREAEVTLVELAVWVTGRHYGVEISRFWKMYKRVKKEDAPVITDDGWVKARNGALVRFQHPSRGWLFAWIVSMNPGAAVADIRYIDSTGAEVGAVHSLKGIVYVKDGDLVQRGPGNQGQDTRWAISIEKGQRVILAGRVNAGTSKQMSYEFLCRYYKPVVEDFPAGVEVNPGIMQSDGYTSPMDQ